MSTLTLGLLVPSSQEWHCKMEALNEEGKVQSGNVHGGSGSSITALEFKEPKDFLELSLDS